MQRIRPDVDIIRDLLEAVIKAQPDSVFATSLLGQYDERGGLSKKQLQGLYGKALRLSPQPVAKLATLEAIILKRPTRYKSILPVTEKDETANDPTGGILKAILEKFPMHKRVLFLKSKFDHKEILSPSELAEIARFEKLAAR